MDNFASIMPPPLTVPTFPPRTATSEQDSLEVDPGDLSHQDTLAAPLVGAEDSHTGQGNSDNESEIPPPQFMDTITAVYKYLPEEVCPKMEVPPPIITSLFEAGTPTLPREMLKLPFSPTVGLLVKDIEGRLLEDGRRAGNYVPGQFAGKHAKYYVPHNSAWPVKPPALDKDAGLIGVKKPPTPGTSVAKVWESTDRRVRSIVAMASHIDLCLGASKGAMAQEDGAELEGLLQSAAKASRHILGTALAVSSDMLLWKRDAALASSSLLPGPSRDALRAAPLASSQLLGAFAKRPPKRIWPSHSGPY